MIHKNIEQNVKILKIVYEDKQKYIQFLTKAGYLYVRSDGRYNVTFLLNDDTKLLLSLSRKQAKKISKGTRGTLIYKWNKFIKFIPE